MAWLQPYLQYFTDMYQNIQLQTRLMARLRRNRPGYSPLARAVEDRLVKVLQIFPRKPLEFTIHTHERLDPLDQSHGTWRLGLESTRPTKQVLRPGDMAYVEWENRPETVDAMLRLLGLNGHERVTLKPQASLYQPRLPFSSDVRTALTKYMDCEMASIALLRWAGLESQAEHNEKQDRDHEIYHAKVMETLDWSLPHPPYKPFHYYGVAVLAHGLSLGKPVPSPQEFLSYLEPAGGRSYTITGFSKTMEGRLRLDITVSQIYRQVEVPQGPRQLLPARASHFLIARQPGTRLKAWILPDSHNLSAPVQQGIPALVICTGSGISGFLSLARTTEHVPSLWLIYGVRSWKKKSLYGSELEDYRARGILSRMDIAISRPEDGEGPARHVQDVLWEQRSAIAERLKSGAGIFVCGGQTMGDQVRELMKKILVDQEISGDNMAAETCLRSWEQSLRYQASVSGI